MRIGTQELSKSAISLKMVGFPSMFYKILTQIRVNLLHPCHPCSLFHKTKRCVHTVAQREGVRLTHIEKTGKCSIIFVPAKSEIVNPPKGVPF